MRTLEITSFDEIAAQVKQKAPLLYEAIDSIPRIKRPPLIKATYHYNDDIVWHSQLQLPDFEGNLIPLSHWSSQHKIKKLLDYSLIPVTLVMHKQCEVYVETLSRTIPLNCINSGECFGLFETLTPNQKLPPVWNVSAGARSLFMLPKITDIKFFNHLKKKYTLATPLSMGLQGQSLVFRELLNKAEAPWQCEVLFFTKGWFQEKTKDWVFFRNCMLEMAWQQTCYIRDEHGFSFLWERLMAAIAAAKLKPSPYQIATVRHLIAIHLGSYPAFAPADREKNHSAPIATIQDIYVNDYGLKGNLPILMELSIRRKQSHTPIYYSLSHPTIPLGNHLKNPRGIIQELHMIHEIMALFQTVLSDYSKEKAVSLFELPILTFFHLNEDEHIHLFNTLPDYDANFLGLKDTYPSHDFPTYSPFARGCIQIQ